MSRIWLAYKLFRYMNRKWSAAWRIAGDHQRAHRMLERGW